MRNAYTSARAVYEELSHAARCRTPPRPARRRQGPPGPAAEGDRRAPERRRPRAERAAWIAGAGAAPRAGLLLLVGIAVGLLANPMTGTVGARWVLAEQVVRQRSGFVYHGQRDAAKLARAVTSRGRGAPREGAEAVAGGIVGRERSVIGVLRVGDDLLGDRPHLRSIAARSAGSRRRASTQFSEPSQSGRSWSKSSWPSRSPVRM